MSLAGMLARKCGINDPDTFVANVFAVAGEESAGSLSMSLPSVSSSLMLSSSMLSTLASSASSKFAPSPATTTTTTTTTMTIDYARAMKTLRQRTSTLVPPPRTLSTRAAFNDILEIMDEIQEAMDTAEETESGLRSLCEMKANEMRKLNGRATTTTTMTTNDGDAGGAATTIGFGITGATGNDALVGGSTTVLFADATTTTTTTGPPTMMIVKKKKKPMQQQQQRPSSGEEPSKCLKTN